MAVLGVEGAVGKGDLGVKYSWHSQVTELGQGRAVTSAVGLSPVCHRCWRVPAITSITQRIPS